MNKPFDPRLLRYARSSRGPIFITVLLTVATTATVAATALFIARAVAPIARGEGDLRSVLPAIIGVAVCFVLRALFHGLTERYAHRAGLAVISALRSQLLHRAAALGPRWLADKGQDVATLASSSLDDLQPYFVRYLPQLLLSAILTPAMLVVVWTQDMLAAITLIIVIPLIPLFMWLVGVVTRGYAIERMNALARLGSQILDLIAGLPTLKALGRALGPAQRITKLSQAQRKTTMETLRVAFLSGAILELLATLGVAMVAVGVGLRMVYGGLSLEIGLAVIILAPEVLNPLRAVGTHFHASADGMAAASQAFEILDEIPPTTGTRAVAPIESVSFTDISIRAGDRDYYAPRHISGQLLPGTITALTGPNGSGKSSLVLALLGLHAPDQGTITLHTTDGPLPLSDADIEDYWRQVAWVPQRPVFEPGTIREVVGSTDSTNVDLTGLRSVVSTLPAGWDTPIGTGGVGLSLGQRQRLALTRALLAQPQILFLDEPTAHLDEGGLDSIHQILHEAKRAGKIVVVIAHRPSLVALADHVIALPAVVRA